MKLFTDYPFKKISIYPLLATNFAVVPIIHSTNSNKFLYREL
jgi:hypothetical protein